MPGFPDLLLFVVFSLLYYSTCFRAKRGICRLLWGHKTHFHSRAIAHSRGLYIAQRVSDLGYLCSTSPLFSKRLFYSRILLCLFVHSFSCQNAWFLDLVYKKIFKNLWIRDPVYERTVEKPYTKGRHVPIQLIVSPPPPPEIFSVLTLVQKWGRSRLLRTFLEISF